MDNNVVLVLESAPMEMVTVMLGFEDLYCLEYPGLLAVATAMTGDRLDGEDLAQDTMVKTFIHWARVSRLDRPGAWCHRVLVNACRSKLRRRRAERRYLDQGRQPEMLLVGPSPDVLVFWAVVRTLPQRPRMAVALFFAGDRSTSEIAKILNCPEGTVCSDLSRARVVLAEALGF